MKILKKRSAGSKANYFESQIPTRIVNKIANESGLVKRSCKKITPRAMVSSFIEMISQGSFSYQKWAILLSLISKQTISKQAIFKRTTDNFIVFLQLILAYLLASSMKKMKSQKGGLFKSFGNVLIHDATHFRLAPHLNKWFPGNFTKGRVRAVLKIQTIFNLSKGAFSFFKITNLRDPDSTSNAAACNILRKGDLIIRDLGYFTFNSFLDIIKKKAFFLSRFKLHIPVFDINTLQRINITKLLRGKLFFDGIVYIGANRDLKVRIVIVKLPPGVMNERIRKAKADRRSTKINHSKEYYILLGYSILITNVDAAIWDTKQVVEAYRYRWYIENIFKSWKSYLPSCYCVPDRYATKTSVEMHFFMFLIFVCLTIMPLYNLAINYNSSIKSLRQISLFRLCIFIQTNLYQILHQKLNRNFLNRLLYYCKYDTRSDRDNIVTLLFKPKLS